MISACPHPVEVLPPRAADRERVLLSVQSSLGSALGTVIWQTGGILIDHGWLRVLGSGSDRIPRTLLHWSTHLPGWVHADQALTAPVIAEDVLGGMFSLNWGQIDGSSSINEIFYFAPDSLRWEPLSIGYSGFLRMMLSEKIGEFYQDLRWDGWEIEVSRLSPDQGVSASPPPWTREGKNLSVVRRRPAPIREVVEMQIEIARQLGRGV